MFDEARLPDHALMQDPAFAQALRLLGQKPMNLRSGEMLLHRRFLGVHVAMLPRARPPPDLGGQLAELGLRRVPVILSPDHPCDLPRSVRLRKAQELAVLNIDHDSQSQRAKLHPKWRNQLREAEKHRLKVSCTGLNPDPNHRVLEAEVAQGKKHGYANWPPALTAAFASVAPRQTHLFEASLKGKPLAHMLFLTHGAGATYHIGHTTPQGRTVNAHNLLLWKAMRKLASLGIRHLDFGILSQATPDLNRFKLRTGAIPHKTGGTHLYWRPFATP